MGPTINALYNLILDEWPHPEQGFRACLDILRLAASYGRDLTAPMPIGPRRRPPAIRDPRQQPRSAFCPRARSADDAPILRSNIRGPRHHN
jgi:hypothetical protein